MLKERGMIWNHVPTEEKCFNIGQYVFKSYRYILTFDPAQKCYSNVIHRKEVKEVGGLRLMIWDKVKVPLCHYSDAPEESNLWTAWQLFPLDDD